jgi:hypothetical protein
MFPWGQILKNVGTGNFFRYVHFTSPGIALATESATKEERVLDFFNAGGPPSLISTPE